MSTEVLRYEAILITTIPAKTSPNPASTRCSIDQLANHRPALVTSECSRDFFSGDDVEGTGPGAVETVGLSCVTDAMIHAKSTLSC